MDVFKWHDNQLITVDRQNIPQCKWCKFNPSMWSMYTDTHTHFTHLRKWCMKKVGAKKLKYVCKLSQGSQKNIKTFKDGLYVVFLVMKIHWFDSEFFIMPMPSAKFRPEMLKIPKHISAFCNKEEGPVLTADCSSCVFQLLSSKFRRQLLNSSIIPTVILTSDRIPVGKAANFAYTWNW